MKQEDFWMGDADFFAGMMSKVTDLSKNLYLLVTDLQKNLTFVPEKTAEFLGMEAGYIVAFYQKSISIHMMYRNMKKQWENVLRRRHFQNLFIFVWEKRKRII